MIAEEYENNNCLFRLPLNEISTLFLLGNESVVFSKKSLQLYGLDRVATVILFRLQQGDTPKEISHVMNLPAEAGAVIQELVTLLAGREAATGEYTNELCCPAEPSGTPAGLQLYQLLDTCFALEGPEEILQQWLIPYIAHLLTGTDRQVNLLVTITQNADGSCRIYTNGALQGDPVPAERLLPLIYSQLRMFAFQKRERLLTVHGSVLTGSNDQTLLLVGRSGSGKSTLAATLLTRGFALASDEPAVIDSAAGDILTLPLGLGLKEGSWPALSQAYPDLDGLPMHERFDGQKIRYLLPDTIQLASGNSSQRATHLIFPEYRPGAPAGSKQLSIVQTLNQFADAGYHVPGLDEERVTGIIRWLSGIKRHSLHYPSTEDALVLLTEITR